jgi:hypothetical protein
MSVLKKVSEIEVLLRDSSTAKTLLAKVDKGSKGKFDYIPWNETARLLTTIFGTFGWSAGIVDRESHVDANGATVYTVGLDLAVRAQDDESRDIREKHLPGVGVGIAAPNKAGVVTADAHDTAAKGARSDALSVAAKSLGDAFGLFLYDKGDPARSTSTDAATTTTQVAQESTQADGAAPSKPDWYGGTGKDGKAKVGYATAGQAGVFRTNGWTNEQIAALVDYGEFTEVKESQFGDKEHIKPTDPRFNGRFGPGKIVQGGGRLQLVQPTGTDDEF